ncbi:MAG: Hpt domain-containing protein [Candidatus Sericytochromatia bacterium]
MFDQEVFDRLLEIGGPPLALRVIQLFLEHVPGKMLQVETSFAAADYPALERLAHSVKSSAANLGLEDFRRIAAELERSAGLRDVEQVNQLVPALLNAHTQSLALLIEKQQELNAL